MINDIHTHAAEIAGQAADSDAWGGLPAYVIGLILITLLLIFTIKAASKPW